MLFSFAKEFRILPSGSKFGGDTLTKMKKGQENFKGVFNEENLEGGTMNYF